jgi:putative glutamine amidotransferase
LFPNNDSLLAGNDLLSPGNKSLLRGNDLLFPNNDSLLTGNDLIPRPENASGRPDTAFMTPAIRLFVYGTLRPGHAPASVAAHVDRCTALGDGCIAGRLYDLRNYPGAIVDSGDQRIFGQLLELPNESALRRLDAYEGYKPADPANSLFVRTECDVTLDADPTRAVRAYVYVYNRDVSDARLIEGGRYHPPSAMRRPVIGITMDHKDDLSRGGGYALPFDYSKSIEAAGGLPLAIPYKTHPALIPQYVDLCDGILFTGGNDLDPSLYGEQWHPKAQRIDPDRQSFELALLAEVERRRTPCLGVCLGSQIMNVHRGGSLVQFLPDNDRDGALEHRKLNDDGRRHAVHIEPGTILSKTIGRDQIIANTRHKQAVGKLGRGLRVAAHAPDGVIEAIEDPSMPLFLAVQWHPENLAAKQPEHLSLFKLLVERATDAAKAK